MPVNFSKIAIWLVYVFEEPWPIQQGPWVFPRWLAILGVAAILIISLYFLLKRLWNFWKTLKKQ